MNITIELDTARMAQRVASGRPEIKLWVAIIRFKNGKRIVLDGDIHTHTRWKGEKPPTEEQVIKAYHRAKFQP